MSSLPPKKTIPTYDHSRTYPDPCDVDWDRVERFLGFIWKLCLTHRASVTGGCRTVARNEEVGGHVESRHLFTAGWGCATDLVFDSRIGREDAIDRITREGYRYYIGEEYGLFRLHVQMIGVGHELPDY